MRILVTGAGGYIGSVMVPQLLNRGHQVIGIDSFIRSQTSLLDCCYHEGLTVIRGDIRDRELISKYIKKVDAIFPLAALPGAPLCDKDPIGAQTTNLDAIRMLLELRHRDQIIIFPTTNSGYRAERRGEYCTEETPMTPVSLYARLKVQAEKILLEAGNCISLRLASVFGVSPCMRLDLLVNDFTYRAVTDHLGEKGVR